MALYLNGTKVNPTIFPDGTSQVWKLPEEDLSRFQQHITWDFESESEVFHLMQLCWLIDSYGTAQKILSMPYMPYGRQDKTVSNSNCFARNPFLWLLNQLGFSSITTVDAHSEVIGVRSLYPSEAINGAIVTTNATHVCFPDAGAQKRYKVDLPQIVLDKDRDQSTGEIKGLKLSQSDSDPSEWNRILIIDDICDGGRTFIESAKLLHSLAPNSEVNLYVSHGIFSKGVQVLRDAGISFIFTKDGKAA